MPLDWSPDGSKVVYVADDGEGDPHDKRQYRRNADSAFRPSRPQADPPRERLLAEERRHGDSEESESELCYDSSIYQIDPRTKKVTWLTDESKAPDHGWSLAISPDSKRMAMVRGPNRPSPDATPIYLADADGRKPQLWRPLLRSCNNGPRGTDGRGPPGYRRRKSMGAISTLVISKVGGS